MASCQGCSVSLESSLSDKGKLKQNGETGLEKKFTMMEPRESRRVKSN